MTDWMMRIRWLSVTEGGRRSGPPGKGKFAATALLVDKGVHGAECPASGEHFSIVFDLADVEDGWTAARARLLVPELPVGRLLVSGSRLIIMEGPRAVGEGYIL